jgi:rod shape determining protein RodA
MNALVASFSGRARRIGRRIFSRPRIDLPLAIGLLVLALIGLTVLYSASNLDRSMVLGQAVRFIAGGLLLLAISRIPPTLLRAWTPWFYLLGILLLVVLTVLGEGRGADRWLDLGVVRFQPSELMKLAMPMMVAWYLHPRPLPPRWRDIVAIGVLIGIPAILVMEQPDLGTALLIAASGMFVLFLAGLQWWKIGAMLAALAAIAPVAWHFLHDYQRERVMTFLHPENDPLGTGWHIIQSMIAVGSGGVFGKGFNHGTQSKLEFLPEHTTDFIFAVLGEEFGLVGVLVLLRPSGHGLFSAAALAVLVAAAMYAVSAITVRWLAKTDTPQAMVTWLLVSMAVGAGAIALPHWAPVRSEHLWLVAGVGIAGAVGQYTIIEAFRLGEASLLAPLEYTALVCGVVLDFLLWHTLPDRITWVGAAIIVASGLYLLRRERVHVEAEHP